MVGVLVLVGQKLVDDARAHRDREISQRQESHAEQLENLRFVRDRSGRDQFRPFAGLNLEGMNLSGLVLRGADLNNSDLSDADLSLADLGASAYPPRGTTFISAELCGADLHGAILTGAKLSGANLSGAILTGANLSGVDIRGADLRDVQGLSERSFGEYLSNGQSADDLIYDDSTKWPTGFQPPLPDEVAMRLLPSESFETPSCTRTAPVGR